MESERLYRTLEYLKTEFYAAGEEWGEIRNSQLIEELHALVSAINAIEVFLYDKRITTLIDIV
ncbi:MAG: hypothetical protein RR595_06645 [Lysinibacillus sp.]